MTTIDTPATTGDVNGDTPASGSRLAARRHRAGDPPDAEILDAVRAGDQHAFDVVYRRHRPAVERLARRLARNTADADDIVSEVFAATLRATLAGRGPTDDAGPYLLRSVRNTATSMNTRGDGRRTTTIADDDLTRLAPTTAPDEHDDEVGEAFRDLPERFRHVLWSTEIEGASPAELATGDTDPGAVASLSHRARCALRRSYLSVSTRRRCVDPACRSTRSAMPAVVLGGAAASTVARVDRHVVSCADCAAVFDEMHLLAERMPARSLLAVVVAFIKNFGGVTASVIGGAAPIIVVPAAVATLTAGAIVASDVVGDRTDQRTVVEQVTDPPPDEAVTAAVAAPDTATPSDADTAIRPSSNAPTNEGPTPLPAGRVETGGKTNPPTRAAPIDPAPGVGGAGGVDTVVMLPGDLETPPVGEPIDELVDDGTAGVLDTTIGELDDVVDGIGDAVDRTVTTVTDGIDVVLEPATTAIDETVDELEATVQTVVEPVVGALEPVLEPVVDPVVEPVIGLVDEVGGTVLGTGSVVPTTLPAVPSTGELVDDTTDVVVDVTDSVTDLVGGLLGG